LWAISKMRTSFKEYTVDIVDEPTFNVGSADNSFKYDKVYFEDTEFQPTSKHGIKISRGGQIISSALVCETGGATGVHDKSFLIKNDNVLICCCDTIYSFNLPSLTLNWKKELDQATCLSIYSFKDDFIIHGELEIKRIDKNGQVKWNFSAKDIFVTPDGTESIKLTDDKIELTDWDGDKYILNEHGQQTN
jgi:hypothetical protein